MPKKELVNVEFECPLCGVTHFMLMPKDLLDRLNNRRNTGEYIQDILKDFSPVDREKFLTQYCEDCQKKIFGE